MEVSCVTRERTCVDQDIENLASPSSELMHKEVKKKGNKHTDVENFALILMYTRHMGSRWYASDLHVVNH